MDIKWKLYKLWSVNMSPLRRLLTVPRWSRVKYFLSVMVMTSSQTPTVCPPVWLHTVQYVTSSPDGVKRVKFLEIWGCSVGGSWRAERTEGGRGGSVGCVRVNASGSFCGWSHWWGGRSILPATVCIDALRTVHLVGCESFTVPACLTDNMAKGIHLQSLELRVNLLGFHVRMH